MVWLQVVFQNCRSTSLLHDRTPSLEDLDGIPDDISDHVSVWAGLGIRQKKRKENRDVGFEPRGPDPV